MTPEQSPYQTFFDPEMNQNKLRLEPPLVWATASERDRSDLIRTRELGLVWDQANIDGLGSFRQQNRFDCQGETNKT